MTIWWLAFVLGSLFVILGGFAWVIIELRKNGAGKKPGANPSEDLLNRAEEDIDHLFNKEFREELRNRGRMRFEKIIDDNAMFLKQDLDLTISQLNEYMKKEIAKKLDEEFAAYAKAMTDAQQLTINTLQQTATDVEQQRVALSQTLQTSVAAREEAILKTYEDNMALVVEHYVLQALGDQFDMKAQLPYIIKKLEENKEAMSEDLRA